MIRKCLLAALAAIALPAFADGVSISVGQPGFYGRVDIGDYYPAPQLIYSQPLIVQPVPYGVAMPPPMYLHVPPGHAKHWDKHCYEYGACGRPVYFVQDSWYQNVYVPRYRERVGYYDAGPPRGGGGWDRRDHDDDGPGRGHGHGRGHDRD